ncbi:hypothetical protein KGY73_00990 [bacterium]|nr:hypothetical protein [bacterium]
MRFNVPLKVFLGFLLISIFGIGCSAVSTAVDTAERTAGETVGEAVGEKVGEAIVRSYTPNFMRLYTSYIMSYAYGSGGIWIEDFTYEEGDWTKWTGGSGEDDSYEFTKAFLKKTDKGNEWWQVKFYDLQSEDTVIIESLFSPDRGNLLRMRAKFPDKEPGEIPVEKHQYYTAPSELTEESIEGATLGTETIKVPAGTFTAKHVRYNDYATASRVHFFLSDDVPGRIVKYIYDHEGAEEESSEVKGMDRYNYEIELLDYGSGAKSELNSF